MTKQVSSGSVYGFGDESFNTRRASITSEDGFGFGDIEEDEDPDSLPPPAAAAAAAAVPPPPPSAPPPSKSSAGAKAQEKVLVADVKASPAVPIGNGRRGSASEASKKGGGSVANRLEASRIAAAERAAAAKVARQEKEHREKSEQKRRESAFAESRRISRGELDQAAIAEVGKMMDQSPEPLGQSWNDGSNGSGNMRDLGMKASVDFSLLQNTMSGLRKASGIVDPAPSSNDNNTTITATTNASTSSLKPVDRAKSYHGRVSTSSFGGSGGGNKLGAAADAGSPKVRPKSAIAGLSNSQVFAADDTPDDQLEKVSKEALEAARWTNAQIAKLIEMIKVYGVRDEDTDITSIKFKVLFDETADVFDALSGICKTAKKYKVIAYEAEQLWQGRHDDTDIVLLQEQFDGVKIKRRKLSALSSPKKSGGFSASSSNTGNQKCHICAKTVYPMEYIGASDKAFHKACFRCKTCNKMLSQNDYAVAHDREFRCGAHHREFEMAGL